ncbi:hypothetical protein NDU88_004999 [Pleurodeles waltl]|uniref:Uncharacterized protein n=1 Tax=Pleurodeles waltl TaxID=8319 RepID=A0AAV7WBG7_PLEWA|nr:hypothetical protein NDU88_004999 [Pleurodeles waltl]
MNRVDPSKIQPPARRPEKTGLSITETEHNITDMRPQLADQEKNTWDLLDRLRRLKHHSEDALGRTCWNNICVVGLPEGSRGARDLLAQLCLCEKAMSRFKLIEKCKGKRSVLFFEGGVIHIMHLELKRTNKSFLCIYDPCVSSIGRCIAGVLKPLASALPEQFGVKASHRPNLVTDKQHKQRVIVSLRFL